jgi:ketosteroid isomerase-like protein
MHGVDTIMADANTPTATVNRMFAAFGAGDLDALLDTVHPDSHWTYYGANPRLSKAEFRGRAEVRRFFERILERLHMTAFNPRQYVAEGDTVVIFGSESGTVKSTGQPFRNEWSQKYVVRDGLIVEMSEYNIQVEPRT